MLNHFVHVLIPLEQLVSGATGVESASSMRTLQRFVLSLSLSIQAPEAKYFLSLVHARRDWVRRPRETTWLLMLIFETVLAQLPLVTSIGMERGVAHLNLRHWKTNSISFTGRGEKSPSTRTSTTQSLRPDI